MSSGSESDEDYVPGEPEHVSEEESADEETENQYETESEQKSKKRKAAQEKTAEKRLKKTRQNVKEVKIEEDKEPEEKLDLEEEKKKEEDLWAKFLEGTDTKAKAKEANTFVEQIKPLANQDKPELNDKQKDDVKNREKRIFEFAGETIVVENNVIKERMKTDDSTTEGIQLDGPSQTRLCKSGGKSGGISDILGQINKKNKLSTLEKSKLDWTTYKQEEGIEEEIRSHNKGKHGYLERRDFLERADMRQYEIERDMKMSRRSNR